MDVVACCVGTELLDPVTGDVIDISASEVEVEILPVDSAITKGLYVGGNRARVTLGSDTG